MPNFNSVPSSGAPRQTDVATAVPWRILVLSIVIFASTLVVFFGMKFGYMPFLDGQINRTNLQISDLSKKVSEEQQRNLFDVYSQLYNIKTLSANHVRISNFFSFLERTTQQTISLDRAAVDRANKTVTISGVAFDYETVVNQLSAYRQSKVVKQATLSESKKIEDGVRGISFTIQIQVTDDFFTTTSI